MAFSLSKSASSTTKQKDVNHTPALIQPRQGVPNVAIRTNIFSVCNKLPPPAKRIDDAKSRIKITVNGPIGNAEVIYRGPLLNQDDRDVWMALIDLARRQLTSQRFEIHLGQVLTKLGIADTTTSRRNLWDRIRMLTHSRIELKDWPGIGSLSTGLLLTAKEKQEGEAVKDSSNRYYISVDPELARLFITSLTSPNLIRRAALSGMIAKWLHDFVSSQRDDQIIIRLEDLMLWMGSDNKSLKSFGQKIRLAINELKSCERPLLDSSAASPWNEVQDGIVKLKRVKSERTRCWNDSPEIDPATLQEWWPLSSPI